MTDILITFPPVMYDSPYPKPEKSAEQFRNYIDSERKETVLQTYRDHHVNQTVSFVRDMKEEHLKFNKARMSIWDAIEKLDKFVDDSDPDVDFPQIYHSLQTAEDIRKNWPDLDWMHLVGLLHDLGKIIALPEYGNLPQWAVVGDTFPVGCRFSPKIVYSEFLKENVDSKDPRYNTENGIYQPQCGIENIDITWGHDEYMYQVCVHNNCKIPKKGLNMIRFHSFYPWHKDGEYFHLMNKEDHETLQWVKRFNPNDLYSKREKLPDPEALKPYYQGLIHKYFPNPILEW